MASLFHSLYKTLWPFLSLFGLSNIHHRLRPSFSPPTPAPAQINRRQVSACTSNQVNSKASIFIFKIFKFQSLIGLQMTQFSVVFFGFVMMGFVVWYLKLLTLLNSVVVSLNLLNLGFVRVFWGLGGDVRVWVCFWFWAVCSCVVMICFGIWLMEFEAFDLRMLLECQSWFFFDQFHVFDLLNLPILTRCWLRS